jgi:hypothetical protein
VLCDFSCRNNKLFENNNYVVSFCGSCRWMSFANEYSKVSVQRVRNVYSLSCVVDVRFRLQKLCLMIYDLRFFLTKQLTFLRPSLLYTIYYSVLMNVFLKLGNYTRILGYTAKYKFVDRSRQTWRSKNSRVGRVVSAIFPGFTL